MESKALFLKGDPDRLRPQKTRDHAGKRASPPRIRCPACGWEPGRDDHWSCACGHAWNTFDTFGQCPACDRQWTDTQCPRCHVWSKHRDWYADDES